ncbi:MAG: hypothetical protein E7277_03810 [Lachnospiraceae bacterium]|nr:hypothetical protein [Lachnospiraceae bacterium]
MKRITKILMALLLSVCCVLVWMPLDTTAKLVKEEEEFWNQPAGNILESYKYKEEGNGVSITAYIKFSNGSGANSFDFFIVREDGSLIHDEAAKGSMSHTSSGSYYYYTLKTTVKAGEKIKAGCYAVSGGLKSDADCLGMAMDVTIPTAVVLDPSKAGKQCEKCGSTNYKEIGRIDSTETMHTMSYQCKDCAHCWEVTEEHTFGDYKNNNNSGYHTRECSVCGETQSQKCDFEVLKASPEFYTINPENAAKYHNATYKCKVCGFKKTEKGENHTGKHSCSVCKWTDKKPGKPSNLKIKVKSKKSKSMTFVLNGHFDSHGNWVPPKTTNGSFKICKVAISYKPPRDGYLYIIRQKTGSGTTAKTVWTTKKTSGTYEMWFTSSDRKAKIEIDIYNKNGIKRTIKKTIKV